MTRIRLVIASPSDVASERDAVEKVVEDLNNLLGRSNDFFIDVYRWETDSGPGFHVEGPQGKIDRDLPIADCDIMVAIFWTRLGRPIRSGSETGTVHEINLALERWKTSRRPQILVYFKTDAPDWNKIDGLEIERVKNFQKQFEPGGQYELGLHDTFVTVEDFKDKLRRHLPHHLPKDLHGTSALPLLGFDFQGYRMRFGYAPRWDLSNIGVAQAPGDAPVSPTLEQIYQELRIGAKLGTGVALGAPLPPEEVAALQERIILIGAGGAGKTTWIRHTFFQLLQRLDVCPFLIELRKVASTLRNPRASGKARSLVSHIEAALEEMDCGTKGLEYALKDPAGPRPILLVDGWDELGGLGQEFRQKLAGFLRAHSRVGVIVTSRPYGLEKPDGSDGFEERYIQAWSDQEIEAFSNRFWAICYGEDPKHAEAAQRFRDALKSPSARALAATPLLCTMMLFISRSRALPDERHDLYQACIEHMLSAYRREDAQVPGMPHHWRPEKMNERLRAAAALAFAIHRKRQSEKSQAIVLPATKMAQLLPESCEENRQGFLGWLAGPVGLLTDHADGSLSFAHMSFQEYLAAWHIANVLPENRQLFDTWSGEPKWSEVLRLWAAILWSGRRERFAAVAEQFLQSDDGLCVLGGMLADGWGTDGLFRRWIEKFLIMVETCHPLHVKDCGLAWAASRQLIRRRTLQEAWHGTVPRWNWFARYRAEEWSDAAGLILPLACGKESVIHDACNWGVLSESHCAWGRIWAFAAPAWPEEPWEIALCQVWPSSRRVLGMQAQTFVSLMGENSWTKTVANAAFHNEPKSERRTDERELAQYLTQQLSHHLGAALARYWGCDWARHWTRYWARDCASYWSRYWSREWSRGWDQDLTPEWAMHLAQHWARDLARGVDPAWVSDFANAFGLDSNNSSVADLAVVESCAQSRGSARARLASLGKPANPVVALISSACRESLNPGKHTVELDSELKSCACDPIWPALSRHIARRSTTTDRELLIDLARHPQKREPPLRWGLQYFVRGDVRMPDESIRPLDDFFARYGLQPLPYLDEMPDEVELGQL